jgi:hydroxyacylglutathione hydrolase
MFLRMIYDDKLAAAAYLIGCQRTRAAIVIDPQRDIDRYLNLAKQEGLELVAATETHIHADFLSGVRELAEKGATVYLSDEGGADWKYQWLDKKVGGGSYEYQLLKNGDLFHIGNIEFKVIHTPGHTPEHICFLVTDRGGGADEPMGVATGDFVFVGDLGRPDLLESAAGMQGVAAPSAHLLYRSVQKFLGLPDYLQVWPSHGAGSACGKALGAVPQSTVGYEKRFNQSILAASNENNFVNFILSGQPEPPLYFARMKRDNQAGPNVLRGLPQPKPMSAQQLASLNGSAVALIDTRPWAQFMAGHVPGSLFHPINQVFSTDTGSMIGENEEIYLIIEPGKLDEAVRALVRVGLDKIRGWFEPSAVSEYAQSGGKLERTREVGVQEAKTLANNPETFVLDVRGRGEFSQGHIPQATNIAHTRLASRLKELPKQKQILVNCRSGARSARACALLQKNGYSPINLAGGMLAWDAQ